jgi:Holliday junction resolvase
LPTKLDPKTLAKIAFALYPSVFPGGEGSVDSESLSTRLNDIRKGFLPENELFAILSWLGNCAAIHRIDQTPMPVKDTSDFRAPDFLVFAKHNGRIVPLLIECKAPTNNKLKWSESYLNSLKYFASVLKLPLLVAWKFNNMWLVVDSSHFQRKVTGYHLDYETAIKENLMSLCLGTSGSR